MKESCDMRQIVSADEVLAAARAVRTTFEDLPRDPVGIGDPSVISERESAQIIDRYTRHGFAVLQLSSVAITPGTLLELAESLGLGDPFVPPLYTKGGNRPRSVSRISAASNLGTSDQSHPSFGRTVGQRLHCDGTLQEIGYIKASVLLCESPAAQGGDTTLFNSSAAYAQLAATDRPAAVALATPGVLIRQANINGCSDMNAGPAFSVRDGQLVCGYSVTETDRWAVPDGAPEASLYRGVGFLSHAALPGSPDFVQLRLGPGQAIVFDNTRISHGRTPYRDSEDRRRCLYRSLHLRHPCLRVPELASVGEERAWVI
jgi:alpha-ketoglutarate-dependent taurine dioxygenase